MRLFRRGDPLGESGEGVSPPARPPTRPDRAPQDWLPRGMRQFGAIALDMLRGELNETLNARIAERARAGDERWAELTGQFATERSRLGAATVGFTERLDAVEETMRLAKETMLALGDRLGKLEAQAGKAAPDPELLARLGALEARVTRSEAGLPPLPGSAAPAKAAAEPEEPAPPPPDPTQALLARLVEGQAALAKALTQRPTPHAEDGEEEPEEEPAPARKPVWDEEPPRPPPEDRSGRRSTWPAVDEMLARVPKGRPLNLPRFLWALAEDEGAVNRNRLSDAFKERAVPIGLPEIEAAAKGLALEETRNKKGEPVYRVGAGSRNPNI